MRWERRKSRWPLMAGLICLVALAVAAPYCWQHPVLNVHELMANQQECYSQQRVVFTEATIPQELQMLPSRVPFDLDDLRGFCGIVQEIVDTLPVVAEETLAAESVNGKPVAEQAVLEDPTEASPPLFKRTYVPPLVVEPTVPVVRVESASDRLAMLMPRRPRGEYLNKVLTQTASVASRDKTVPADETRETELEKSGSEQSPPGEQESELTCPIIRQRPSQLFERLECLTAAPATGEWATHVLKCVQPLTDETETTADIAKEKLAQLRILIAEGKAGSQELRDPGLQQLWLQAAEGLERRIGIWELLSAAVPPTVAPYEYEASGTLMPVLGDIASLLAGTANGEAWREYLLLDQIALATSEGVGMDRHARLTLAQEVMSRLSDSRLTAEQRDFIANEPLASLGRELRPWATGPVDLNILMALVERYETQGGLRYAAAIAQLEQRMLWSNNEQLQSLAEKIHDQYRGANMRIAISRDLMNRLIPEQHIRTAPVRETISGKRVLGRSRTSTDVEVDLLPNEEAWQFELHADGKVYSRTRSDTWPVRVHNSTRYTYEAEKVITIDPDGLSVTRARSTARGRNDFLGADSRFDRIPILGAMFRDIGKRQSQKNRRQAMSQVKAKVAYQARTRMDHEADPKFSELEQRFQANVLAPFGNLALAAETVDMHTTAKRAVIQLRLANLDQLASHTPRPSAPADSVLSMQLHETALNNALAGLELEGLRVTLPELHTMLAEKLGFEDAKPPEDLSKRAIVEFAPYDAVHVSFAQDRLELIMNIRELSHGRDRIPHFEVHSFHRPVVDGLRVKLVQEETLQFEGRNLRTGHRMVLHSVMGKMFNKAEEIAVLKKMESDKRLTGLMVTQLVIGDGWLGVALGPASPQRTAWRTPFYQVEAESVR